MKTKQVIFTLSCLVFFAVAGQSDVAQTQESSQEQRDREMHKNNLRSYYWGDERTSTGTAVALLSHPKYRAALSISDESYQEFLSRWHAGTVMENPEYRKAKVEYEEAMQVVTGLPHSITPLIYVQDLDEEQLTAWNRAQEVLKEMDAMRLEYATRTTQRPNVTFQDAIGPELWQKIQEAQLAVMGETVVFSPSLFEILNLTDAQKEGMERIKKELEPDFERHLEVYAHCHIKAKERVLAALQQRQAAQPPFDGSRNARKELVEMSDFLKKLQEGPEHERFFDDFYASGKAFSTLFRTRMFDILNDEQRKRLQELIDNPPPLAKALIHNF